KLADALLELEVGHLQFGPDPLALIVLVLRHVPLLGEGVGELVPLGADALQLVREPPDRKRKEGGEKRPNQSCSGQPKEGVRERRGRRRPAQRGQLAGGGAPRVRLPAKLPLATLGAVRLAHRLLYLRHRQAE